MLEPCLARGDAFDIDEAVELLETLGGCGGDDLGEPGTPQNLHAGAGLGTFQTRLASFEAADPTTSAGFELDAQGRGRGAEGGEVIVRPSVKAARLARRKSITPNKKAEAKGKK